MDEFQKLAGKFVKDHFGNRAQNLKSVDAGGDWSKAYFFTLEGNEMVIRFGNYVDDYEKDRVMGTYSSETLPIPKVLEVGEAENIFFAVSERVSGKPLDELNGSEIQLVLPELFKGLYNLQKLNLRNTEEVGLWRPSGVGPSWGEELLAVVEPTDRLVGWRERLDASPKYARIFDAGVEKLQQLAPKFPEYRGIVHNDLLNRNVLVNSGRLTGVFDWGNAFYGDPLYDIAWFVYKWTWFPEWQEIDSQDIIDQHWENYGGTPPHMKERLLCCLIHLGLCDMRYYSFRQRHNDLKLQAERLLTYI